VLIFDKVIYSSGQQLAERFAQTISHLKGKVTMILVTYPVCDKWLGSPRGSVTDAFCCDVSGNPDAGSVCG
jgi:hypothetical protein